MCAPTCACVGLICFLKGFKGQQEASGFPVAGPIVRLLHRSPPVFIPLLPPNFVDGSDASPPPFLASLLYSPLCFKTSVPVSFNLFLSFVGLEETRLMPVVSQRLSRFKHLCLHRVRLALGAIPPLWMAVMSASGGKCVNACPRLVLLGGISLRRSLHVMSPLSLMSVLVGGALRKMGEAALLLAKQPVGLN